MVEHSIRFPNISVQSKKEPPPDSANPNTGDAGGWRWDIFTEIKMDAGRP